jgi:hypothetical protein
MKIITQIDSTFSGNYFNKVKTAFVLVFMLSLAQNVSAQLLQQDFSSSTTVSNYVNATTPTNGQFNAISTSGAGTVLSINTTTSNKLRFARTGNAGIYVRTTDFSPTPTSMFYRFDMTISGNSTATTNVATFQVGSGFGTANSTEANLAVHSRLGINFTTTGGQFSLRDIGTSTSSANFTGTQTVLMAINNTGATLTYRAPDGTYETVANDTQDVWVGTTRVFNDMAATTASQTLTDIKFAFSGANGTIDFDNFLIDPIPGVPTSGAATAIGSGGFTANWTAISGVTGYRLDVATDAAFTSLVTGYNNLYIAGQATSSAAVSGLNPNTTYYYRVRGASQYAVGEFAGGNSTTQNLTTNTSYSITYANLQFPTANQSISEGASLTYYGRVYAAGVTDSPGEGTLIDAWVGYSASNSDPSGGGWTWVAATYNADDGANNDEYNGTLSALTPGTYYVAYRYSVSTGPYVYGGKNNAIWASTSDNAQLTVNSLLVDWCNVQYPPNGTTTQGDAFNVYAKVYLAGVTDTGSPGAGISGWIGYSTSNTNPNTWTNWVSATFNADSGNDDEYVANIGTGLAPGTYYYASRFQRTGSTEYLYGDLTGIWDNTTENGVLTVNPQVPVITPASPTGTYNSVFNYSIIATNSPTSYALSSGTLPTGITLNTSTGVISGTPTQIGTFNLNFTATNSGGASSPAAINITIDQAGQTVTFGALTAVTYGDAPFALTATASSGLAVSYLSSNTAVATVSGSMVTIVGEGITTITASQAGDANYTAATSVDRTLTVNKKDLTITGVTANNKVQDGTTTATLSGTPTLVGIVSGDESNVTLSGTPTATFATAAPGTGIAVSVTGYALSGSASVNYTISQPTGLTANITALGVPTATAASGISYDGFTANWDTVTDASGYLLDVYTQSGGITEIFNQQFTWSTYSLANGTGGNSGGWSGSIASNTFDIPVWTEVSAYKGDNCAKIGTGSVRGSLTTPTFGIAGNAVLTFRAGAWDGASEQTTLLLEITGGGSLSVPSVTMAKGSFSNYTVNITGATASTQLTFRGFVATNSRFFIDDIKVEVNTATITPVAGSPFSINAPTTTYNVTGLNPETNYYYNVSAVNGSFTSDDSNEISLTTEPAPVTWNGTAWSNITGPTSDIEAIIAGVFSTAANGSFTASKLTLNSGSFTVNSNNTITVVNEIVNNMSAADFIIENNANLLQSGTTNNNVGNITVRRNSSALKRLDYTLWSSPVTGQEVYAFSPFTFANRFYVYRTNTNLYNNSDLGFNVTGLNPDGVNGTDSNNVQFASAKGYLIRMPWNHPTVATVWNGTFTGLPNSGDIPFTMTNGGVGQRFNLVGNPYPSPISMTQFVSDNSSSITGTLYFWRETNGTSANNAYCSWAGGTFTTNGQAQVVDPNGIIRTGQGFIVEASGAATSLIFNNGQRSSDNANQFFRTNNVTNDVIETNRFWLNLTNTDGAFSQMAAGYMTNATNDVDLYDGRNINTGSVLLNSILDNADYTIQGKALPFNTADVIPLSFKVTDAGEYTIAIDHVDGLFTGGSQAIYLKDNLTSSEHNLQTNAYTFTSAAGTFNNRFEIVYQSQLGIENPTFTADNVVIYSQGSDFVINSGNTVMDSIKVFDIRGRLLQERKVINASQATINGGAANGVLLVQITSEDGAVVTKKVIR